MDQRRPYSLLDGYRPPADGHFKIASAFVALDEVTPSYSRPDF